MYTSCNAVQFRHFVTGAVNNSIFDACHANTLSFVGQEAVKVKRLRYDYLLEVVEDKFGI